ncbi:surfeit locus protein [Lobosporangium transversale]|uniref:Surfeit locus protein 6-domain-containing protein n=1 Tax=Lobosporangium transversale TaxID=64571 RepID=A0A1Y2G8I3_9FUNG|nr:surfeit locus protein 6-domain-containing protein [Lobosporangium transversale]KAF9902889.1 surfeit locus protein [Lobosporangium transversale]ORY99683.1 surfeit locus protein 6-domain-containing protein [Lobosporangium transversale]|eukprot:XP_021875947.1 surfeit locus protein 6-domain-containing protein [Lobosporangium transversale]
MSTHFELDGLEERIKEHGSSFDSLLKLIPAQYYITKELSEEEQNSKYQHNKKRNAPKQEIKERTKKAKKAKLDPENNKSVTEIQSEMITKANNSIDDDSDNSDDDDNEEADDSDVEMDGPENNDIIEDDSEAPVIAKSSTHNFDGLLAQVQTAAQTPAQPLKSITELRAKLEERLAKLRGRRGANAEANGAGAKPTSRQAILEARLKRKKDKKASQKLAKEKRAAGGSEGLVVKEPAASSSTNAGRPSASSINDKGEVRFSKFEFAGLQKKKKGPTDAQGQLKMVEAHKEKLAALEAANPEKANAMKEKDTWKKALQLAQGEKVKDDVKLLKKTIKREEVFKKKSAKEWGERKATVKKTKDQKQKKREENIKARIDAAKNKGKKGSKGAPKGGKGNKNGKPKARAGFEGKNAKKSSKPSKK